MDQPQQIYEDISISSYDCFLSLTQKKFHSKDWAFRGHHNADWKLSPSLERSLDRKKNLQGLPSVNEMWEELELLRQFKRRALHYISDAPSDDDELEWLALMQHHGAPTRLLDWTWSPYVGLFFAVAEAPPGATSDLWAVNTRVLNEYVVLKGYGDPNKISRKERADWFKKILFAERRTLEAPFIMQMDPFRANARLTIQQGTFLFASRVDEAFQPHLEKLMKEISGQRNGFQALARLRIENGDKLRMLRELGRMNISYATLFPGIDGFARSLGTRVAMSPQAHIIEGPAHGE